MVIALQKKIFIPLVVLGIIGGVRLATEISKYNTSNSEGKEAIVRCKEGTQETKTQCWLDLLNSTLRGEGIEAALNILASFSGSQSDGETCHALAHQIGEQAYQMFVKNKEFRVTPKSIYCDFGFFHGFMEAFVTNSGDFAQARAFCEYIEDQLSGTLPDVALQCYHGIGHGVIEAHDPQLWGNVRTLVSSATELCEKVTDSDLQLENCLSGVFNGLGNSYASEKYGLQIDTEDPLWVCREQPEKYKSVCYGLMVRTLLVLAENDFRRALSSIDQAVEKEYKTTAASNIAVLYALQGKDEEAVSGCRGALDNTLRLPCIKGYVVGLFQSGKPEKEYVKPLEFCRSPLLLAEERTTCFSAFQGYLGILYPRAKVQEICTTIDEEYRERAACGNNSSS